MPAKKESRRPIEFQSVLQTNTFAWSWHSYLQARQVPFNARPRESLWWK
jgi:hypothetical protein